MESENPLISIITPCFNYGKFLPECLESLKSQSYSNWECIIINDGSTDDTEEIALRYVDSDPRFKYVYQQNAGLPAARNTALRIAKGDYIQLLDADDLLEPEKFTVQLNLFALNQSIDLIYSSMVIFYSDKNSKEHIPFVVASNPVSASGKHHVIINLLLKDVFFLPGCAIFTRKLFEKVGLFNEELYGLEDWNYWFRAALLGFEFYHDPTIGARLVVRDHSTNMSKAYFKMLNARIIARKNIIDITQELKKSSNSIFDNAHYKSMILTHSIFLNKDLYEYNFHHGKKLSAIKSIFKYAFYSNRYFYPFKKITASIFTRIKP